MINKKLVFTAVVSAVLTVGMPIVFASASNDLLRMDVKKSSAQDSVDVTFYTTGTPTNSVVTRKSGNSYVVLLPNVSGSQSVVPSLGGVKDLVSDINVKHVDDGIGGYTKITFSTTKPLRIQTSTRQTAPLTSAQQNYKNLIAQSSNIKPVNNTSNTAQNKTASQPVKAVSSAQKPAVQTTKSAVQTAKPSASNTNTPKASTTNTSKASNKTTQPSNATPKTVAPAPVKSSASSAPKQVAESKPKASNKSAVKPKNEVKSQAKSAPKAQETVKPQAKEVVKDIKTTPAPKAETKPVADSNLKADNIEAPKPQVAPVAVKADKTASHKTNHKVSHKNYSNPIIPAAGAFCLFGIFLFAGLAHIITRGVEDKRNRLREYLENEETQTPKKTDSEFQAIMDDKEANWQEKYRRYTKVNESKNKYTQKSRMSYVADASTSKGMVVSDEQLKKNKMQETISRMEHSLAQTPASEQVVEDFSTKYHSEDDAISNKMSEIKLKSFANPVDLSHAGRNLVSFEELASRKKTLKEGKFVKMNNSSLTMSKRKSASSGMNFASIVRNGNNYIHNNKDAEIMSKQQEDYVLSSLNEYMNLLDSEKSAPVPMIEQPQEISKALANAQQEMNSKSLVTNPMASQRKMPFVSNRKSEINGLNIKSNYNIDSNKSIYMVDLDGISAIIGKIGDEVYVLKKFDKIVNKPMQVRLDYGNTYIVRVGSFKCLVDVAEDKMGMLLEI